MARAKLPETIREKIKALYGQGYQTAQVFRLMKNEALLHLQSEEELKRCLKSLKGKVGQINGPPPPPPNKKAFDAGPFESTINGLQENMPGKELEAACLPIAEYVLKKYEKFTKLVERPPFQGTPFDLFGFKNGSPYLIELKTSLNSFHHPGETQKWRMQELLRRNKGLKVALLQLAARKRLYRIFYDDQLNLLFFGPKAPLDPIEKWIRERLGQ